MRLSFAIPAYNEEAYLGACLESILAQTRELAKRLRSWWLQRQHRPHARGCARISGRSRGGRAAERADVCAAGGLAS